MPKYESKCPQHTELDLYAGCSFNCIYCITNQQHKIYNFSLKRELDKIAGTEKITKPYYLSPWTDAYQPLEEQKKHTRQVIEALSAKNQPFFVITKSTLVKRDIDLFRNKKNAFIAISLNTLNDDITSKFEPGAPSASERRQLIEELVADKSINTVVKIDPILPAVTDKEELTALLEWLVMVKPTAVTAETLRLSKKIISRMDDFINNALINSILEYYPEVYDQPIHPYMDYRMKVLNKVAMSMNRAGVKASFCQASLPYKITEFDCRGGYNYDY